MRWVFFIALISCGGTKNSHKVEGSTEHRVKLFTDICDIFDSKDEKKECVKLLLESLNNKDVCSE